MLDSIINNPKYYNLLNCMWSETNRTGGMFRCALDIEGKPPISFLKHAASYCARCVDFKDVNIEIENGYDNKFLNGKQTW